MKLKLFLTTVFTIFIILVLYDTGNAITWKTIAIALLTTIICSTSFYLMKKERRK